MVKNWYMRFYKRFFADREIHEIEALPESKFGHNFPSLVIHLYFKLMAYSIETNGNIIFRIEVEENTDLAYSVTKRFFQLSKFDEIKRALIILQESGLIEIIETPDEYRLFIPSVIDNTYSVKLSSEERQQRRLAAKNGLLPLAEKPLKKYGSLNNVFLTEEEYEHLSEHIGSLAHLITSYGYSKAGRESNHKQSDYENILRYSRALEEGDGNG